MISSLPRGCSPALPSSRYARPRGERLCGGGDAPPSTPSSSEGSARAATVSSLLSSRLWRIFVSGGRYCFPRSRAAFSWCILSAVMPPVRAAAAIASLTSFLATMPTELRGRPTPTFTENGSYTRLKASHKLQHHRPDTLRRLRRRGHQSRLLRLRRQERRCQEVQQLRHGLITRGHSHIFTSRCWM